MPRLITDPAEFQAWRDGQVTQEFLAFLQEEARRLADLWTTGADLPPRVQHRAQLFRELSEISFEWIAATYGVELKEQDDGRQEDS